MSCYGRRRMPFVDHLHIENEKAIDRTQHYFPNITKLTFFGNLKETHLSLPFILTPIVPLKQLTTLNITQSNVCLERMLKLLSASPNIHTLTIQEQSNSEIEAVLKEPTESFRLLSESNKITTIVVKYVHYKNIIEFLILLCPRMQHLTVDLIRYSNEPIIQLILSKAKSNLPDLCLLCVKRMAGFNSGKVKTLIETEELLDNYSIRVIKHELYIWW